MKFRENPCYVAIFPISNAVDGKTGSIGGQWLLAPSKVQTRHGTAVLMANTILITDINCRGLTCKAEPLQAPLKSLY